MKQVGLAPVTLLTLALTSLLLPYSGWFASRTSARTPARPEVRCQARERDLSSEAAARFRSAQPYHWRALLLHH